MADNVLTSAIRCARRALERPTDPEADAHLLDRYVRDRDEAAFTELVARHGPVVWAACRRGAATAADAEDAFQATFLVLARRADRVRRAAAVSGWLFRVAVRLAGRTRTRAARLPGPDCPAPEPVPDPADRAAWTDVVAVLDAELAALPDSIRAALVCCYYEGLTQDEAARRLGWKVRTLRARVARGRTILRRRLARRGVELGAVLAAVAIGAEAAGAAPPVAPVPPAGGVAAGPPAVADLVRDGLAVTAKAAPIKLAVGTLGAAVLAVAGIGYALGVGSGPAPVEGPDGPDETPVAVVPPADVAPVKAPDVPPVKAPEPPAAPKPAFDWAAVHKRAVDGCVYVVNEARGRTVEGSGALIDRDRRLVVTTARVVGDEDTVSVVFSIRDADGALVTDRTRYRDPKASEQAVRGTVLTRDKGRDLALVQLDRLPASARALELAETGFGAAVLHIGSGTGNVFPMAERTVSQVDTQEVTVPIAGMAEQVKAQLITTPGTSDDSGGPLVDKEGRVVGIVEGAATGPAVRNMTVAIDASEVKALLAARKSPDPPVAPRVAAGGDEFKHAELYDKCVTSAVFIVTPMKGGMMMGSGSLIDAEKRYVLTNFHIVDEAATVFVQFPVRNKDGSLMTDRKKYIERIPAGQAIKGKVLHIDKSRDLALVQLEKLPPGTQALPLAKRSVRVGEPVFNIGNPGAVDWTFSTTEGTVRGVGVADMVVGGGGEVLRIKARMVTVTNPINPGDSGGPLIDRRGYQVGVAESGRSGVQNVNNCVDITEVWGFLNEKKITIKNLTDKGDEPRTAPKAGNGGTDSPPPGVGTVGPKKDGPEPDDEKVAAMLLRRAKLFADSEENREFYKGKLKEIVTRYPKTAAAKEAQKILDQLK